MILRPVAKVNLGLNVVERRPDGYHNLETVFYPVPLCDTLEVRSSCLGKRPVGPSGGGKGVVDVKEVKEGGCRLEVSGVTVEGDVQENLVVRAYKLLKADFPQMAAVEARLHKEIPTQAGMGGGSSDCAYMIRGLNELCHLGLSDEQMIGYAARLGADCPFFILSRPAYAEGIGERLRPVNVELGGLWMAIVRPDIPVPTRDAFRLVKPVRSVKNLFLPVLGSFQMRLSIAKRIFARWPLWTLSRMAQLSFLNVNAMRCGHCDVGLSSSHSSTSRFVTPLRPTVWVSPTSSTYPS